MAPMMTTRRNSVGSRECNFQLFIAVILGCFREEKDELMK